MFVTAQPNQDGQLTQYFLNAGTYTWEKPPGISLVSIITVGGGEDGQNGTSAASGTAKQGGRGGGSGAITTGVFSASVIPDYLYISNGDRQVHGGVGRDSFVSISTSGVAGTLVYAYGASGSSVGGLAQPNTVFMPYAQHGFVNSRAGSSGVAGTTAAGTNQTTHATNVLWLSGGAGGGGGTTSTSLANSVGGSVLANTTVAKMSNMFNGVAGGNLTTSLQAESGIMSFKPLMFFTGGAGAPGSTTLSVAAYPGGDGAPGCGGGGGGGGTTGSAGGKGGNGFTIISCK